MSKGELVVYEGGPTDIAVARPPDVVLEEAHKAAKALMDVMGAKKKKVMMNGEQYLEFEDWQTVGRFYGVTVKVSSTEFIDYGGAKGFLAKAVVLRQDGAEISAAEAMCLNDEEKWSTRTKYEWKEVLDANGKMIWEDNPDKPGKKRPRREKVKVGEDAVPLFQLRSMAQTRACAKALRNVLAWVVVLAGYRPTPAEEIEDISEKVEQAHVASPAPPVPPPAPSEPKAPLASPPPAPEGEMDEHTMRDHLAMILSEIADIRNATRRPEEGKLTAGDILVGYTANKDGKYGKQKVNDVAFTMDKRSGGTWSPLTAIFSKATKDLEAMKKEAAEETAFG